MSLFLSLSQTHKQITSMLHSQIYFHTFAPAYCILPFSLTLSLPHTHAHTLPSISTSLSPSHTFPAYHTHTHPISFSIFHASIFPISISLSLPRTHLSPYLSLILSHNKFSVASFTRTIFSFPWSWPTSWRHQWRHCSGNGFDVDDGGRGGKVEPTSLKWHKT